LGWLLFVMSFLDTADPSGQSWRVLLQGVSTTTDAGELSEQWKQCLGWSVVYEHENRDWKRQFRNGPAGSVLTAMKEAGATRQILRVAEKLEDSFHKEARRGTLRANLTSGGQPAAAVLQSSEPVGNSGASSSGSSSGSGSSDDDNSSDGSNLLGKDLAALPQLFVSDRLESLEELPKEVLATVQEQLAAVVTKAKKLKTSNHETFIVEIASSPSPDNAASISMPLGSVVVQILGAVLVDKPVFCLDKPLSAAVLVRAAELSRSAGVRAPNVLGTGHVAARGGLENLEYIIYEFIETQTVEDEVMAPGDQWRSIADNIKGCLAGQICSELSTEPLGRFETCHDFVDHLQSLALEAPCEELAEPLAQLRLDLCNDAEPPVPPTLIHQDLNCGNLLCSQRDDGLWHLDALIDWESAIVADRRIAFGKTPLWTDLRAFGHVVKGCWLAAAVVRGHAPRCCVSELAENHDRARKTLAKRRGVQFRKWTEVLTRCRANATSSLQ